MNEKNRGYQKIEGAARAFNFDFKDKIVLDIGSSTGGFTQYALDHGAKKVIAIEKGTNQMVKSLRYDSRVDLYEKTDIFDVRLGNAHSLTEDRTRRRERTANETRNDGREHSRSEVKLLVPPNTIVADVSFVSLRKILSHAKLHLASSNTEFLVMLKPQFEAKPDQLNKGIVKNEKIRREIIKQFEHWLKGHNFIIINKRDNSLKGKTGNLERFYHLTLAK